MSGLSKGKKGGIRDMLKQDTLKWVDKDLDTLNEMLGEGKSKEELMARFPDKDSAAFKFVMGAQWKEIDTLSVRKKQGDGAAISSNEASQISIPNADDKVPLRQVTTQSPFLQPDASRHDHEDVLMVGAEPEMRILPFPSTAPLKVQTHGLHSPSGDHPTSSSSIPNFPRQDKSQSRLSFHRVSRQSFGVDVSYESTQLELSDIEDEETVELERQHNLNLVEIHRLEKERLKLDRELTLRADERRKKQLRDEIKMLRDANVSGSGNCISGTQEHG